MLRTILTGALLGTLTILAGCNGGGEMNMSEMKKPEPPTALRKLDPWVGEWVGESTMYPGGDKSKPMTSKSWSKVEWVLDGMFLKESFEMDMGEGGKMSGVLIHWYDPAAKHYKSAYFDSTGGTGEGRFHFDSKKNAWIIKWEGDRPDGGKTHGGGISTMPDNDTMTMTFTEKSGWTTLFEGSSTSRRKK